MDKTGLENLSREPVQTRIEGAVAGLKEPDRNVRVMALRVLEKAARTKDLGDTQRGKIAEGILSGLSDDKRRVREIAIKSCGPVMQGPEIAQQLKTIILNPDEKRRNKGAALMALFSGSVVPVDVVRELARSPLLRPRLFVFLLGAPLSPSSALLLEDFAREGDAAEAKAAQRALAGERVVNLAWFSKEERKTVRQTHDAWQGVWIWKPRSGGPEA